MDGDTNTPAPNAPTPTPDAAGQRRHRWHMLIGAVAVLLLALLLWYYFKPAAKPVLPPPVITITTTRAVRQDIGVYLDALGTVTPLHSAAISSQVSGLVIAVHYQEGQLVAKGDALIDIDARQFRATLLQAEGVLQKDESLLAQARMDLERYRVAWASEAIAKQVFDDQDKLVQQDMGLVKTDQGVVQFDRIQVEYCQIRAPMAGRVGLRLVDPGNVVQAASAATLVVITQISPITVIFTIPEDSLGELQPRLQAAGQLSVYAFDRSAQTQLASGELLALDNQIDTTTGTVKARAQFANSRGELFPNQFVNTRLLLNTLRGATLVPASAIQQNGQAAFVYVIQNRLAHVRSITTGVSNLGLTQVTGVQPGEVLANSSFEKLQDKAAVAAEREPVTARAPGLAHRQHAP